MISMRRARVPLVLAVGVLAASASLPVRGQNAPRAWAIVDGMVADGLGGPLRQATVRIVADRIVAVGAVEPQAGDAVVNARGLVVAPGFIDIHNHSSGELAADPAAESQVAQGITTAVLGPDGSSPWPIGEFLDERRKSPAALN